MSLRLVISTLAVAISAWAQTPAGRWDGTIVFGALKVPFTVHFEGAAASLTGSFVNGDTRVASTSGSFEGGKLRLQFAQAGTQLEAVLADGSLKGSYGNAERGMRPFTASAYCTCGYDGDAGPEIMGEWEADAMRLSIRRKGDDTFATLSRAGQELGPLTGRFDGAAFTLKYFDGVRAAVLDIEPRKDKSIELTLREPGADVKKHKAVSRTR